VPQHAWFEADVTDQPALERAVAHCVDVLGGIDIVVANAGIAAHGTVATTPARAMARVIEVNLIGVINTIAATLPHVTARRGYYLLVSSAAALATSPGLAAYAASKIGVEHFGSALRIEVAHKGVDIGIAHPCWIDTDLVRDATADMESFRRMVSNLPGPFGVVSSVDDCAAAMVRAIEQRKRKVYIPKSLAPFAALRQLFMSPLAEIQLRRDARKILPDMEKEVTTLGRSFGEHSVEKM
jgi:short-subunit dehydrogenase